MITTSDILRAISDEKSLTLFKTIGLSDKDSDVTYIKSQAHS